MTKMRGHQDKRCLQPAVGDVTLSGATEDETAQTPAESLWGSCFPKNYWTVEAAVPKYGLKTSKRPLSKLENHDDDDDVDDKVNKAFG